MYMFERRKRRRLEARRQRAVAAIRGERATFETMVKRAQVNGVVAEESLKGVLLRFEEFERKAREARSIEELEDLIDDAAEQGQLFFIQHAGRYPAFDVYVRVQNERGELLEGRAPGVGLS